MGCELSNAYCMGYTTQSPHIHTSLFFAYPSAYILVLHFIQLWVTPVLFVGLCYQPIWKIVLYKEKVLRQICEICLSGAHFCILSERNRYLTSLSNTYKVILNIKASDYWSQNGHMQILSNIGKLLKKRYISPRSFFFSDSRSENFQLG